jgi:hypothetical protein
MKEEYRNYMKESITNIDNMVWELMEAMRVMDEELVVAICDRLIEELNIIKETYTDESLF